jgi:hypothetical protein
MTLTTVLPIIFFTKKWRAGQSFLNTGQQSLSMAELLIITALRGEYHSSILMEDSSVTPISTNLTTLPLTEVLHLEDVMPYENWASILKVIKI